MDRQLTESCYDRECARRSGVVSSALMVFAILLMLCWLVAEFVSSAGGFDQVSLPVQSFLVLALAAFGIALFSACRALWPRDYQHLAGAGDIRAFHVKLVAHSAETADAKFDDWLKDSLVRAAACNRPINVKRCNAVSLAIKLTLTGAASFGLSILLFGLTAVM